MSQPDITIARVRSEFCNRFVHTLNKLINAALSNPEKIPEAREQFKHLNSRVSDFDTYHSKLIADCKDKKK